MTKIFKYECRRLIVNKFFWLSLIITCIYGYFVLASEIIYGVGYTAPFSPWSYGEYLSRIQPILMLIILFFLYKQFVGETHTNEIISATPVNRFRYGLIKCAAVMAMYILLLAFSLGISTLFYKMVFGFSDWDSFLLPTLIVILPSFFLLFGMGLLGVNIIHHRIMLATLILSVFILHVFTDIYGGNFFSTYPLTLPIGIDGEPPFTLSVYYVIKSILFSLLGIFMIVIGLKCFAKNKNVDGF